MVPLLLALVACTPAVRTVLVANQSPAPVMDVALHVGDAVERTVPLLLPGGVLVFDAPPSATLWVGGTPIALPDGPAGAYLPPESEAWSVLPLDPATLPPLDGDLLPWGSELSDSFSLGSIPPERISRLTFYANAPMGLAVPRSALGVATVVTDPARIARFSGALLDAHQQAAAPNGPVTHEGVVVATLEAGMEAWFRYHAGASYLTIEEPALVNEPSVPTRTVGPLPETAW